MNATEITFGVEIETTIPVGVLQVGLHRSGLPIPQLPGWKADSDPSIHSRRGRMACEFVSPVLKGIEGMQRLMADIRTIKSLGAEVNASCGLHVHVGFDRSDAKLVARLTTLVSNFEKAIFASTGTKKRERGRWCGGLNRYGTADAAIQRSRQMRYHVLNLGSEHPTVEIRAFSATLNPVKIAGHVQQCVGLVERAIKATRVTNWTAKPVAETSPIKREGEGQTALTRLFYQLGWIKGRTNHSYGEIAGVGIPTIRACKRALMKMARKYDSQP